MPDPVRRIVPQGCLAAVSGDGGDNCPARCASPGRLRLAQWAPPARFVLSICFGGVTGAAIWTSCTLGAGQAAVICAASQDGVRDVANSPAACRGATMRTRCQSDGLHLFEACDPVTQARVAARAALDAVAGPCAGIISRAAGYCRRRGIPSAALPHRQGVDILVRLVRLSSFPASRWSAVP